MRRGRAWLDGVSRLGCVVAWRGGLSLGQGWNGQSSRLSWAEMIGQVAGMVGLGKGRIGLSPGGYVVGGRGMSYGLARHVT